MKKFWNLMFLSVVVLILAACTDDGSDNEETSGEDSSGDQAETATGGDLIVSVPNEAVSMSPHGSNDVPSEQVRNVIYEGLVEQDENLEIVPLLAEDWEQIDDTTWQFTLQEGITFHDGSEFNAEVVKANIERIQDPAVASPRLFVLEMISAVNIVDDYTVEFELEYPYSPLLNNLSHGAGKMISKELIDEDYENAISQAGQEMTAEEYYELREEGGDAHDEIADMIAGDVSTLIEQEPVGTNYLKFESRNPGENTVLTTYEDYWDGASMIDSVTYKVVSEPGSRIAELETGASDFILGLQTSDINRIEENDDVTLERVESASIGYIGLNTEQEPLNNRLVRQALTHALDKEAVLSGVYGDSGKPAVAPLTPGFLGHSDSLEGLDYDMDRARELLEEAGYADGFDVTLMVNDASPEGVDLAVFLQESFAELEVNVNIEQIEWGAYLEALANGEHDLFILGWSNATGDPDNGLSPLFHSDNLGAAGNRTFFQNDELDALLDEGVQVTDEDERQQIYEQAQELLVEEAPAIFVRHSEYLNAYSNNVKGIQSNSYNLFDFREVSFTE